MKIAILGSTSHIAKGLIDKFLYINNYDKLYLFARDINKLKLFISNLKIDYDKNKVFFYGFDDFMKYQYDMIINCVGFGEPKNLKDAGYKIFSVTESFDNLAIEYLSKINTNTLYINFSSGAVFGKEFFCPASMDSTNNILVNNITDKDFYGIAKINSEAKHRSLNNFYIVDIRVYSYISRFINLTSNFFVTDLINALKDKTKLLTNESDMVRDYVVQDDVYCLIIKCFKKRYLNDSFDIYSKKPCTKFELLDYFKSKHGLDYEIKYSEQANSPTGNKSSYFTDNFKAEKIGYYPSYTSIEGIEKEIKYLIK